MKVPRKDDPRSLLPMVGPQAPLHEGCQELGGTVLNARDEANFLGCEIRPRSISGSCADVTRTPPQADERAPEVASATSPANSDEGLVRVQVKAWGARIRSGLGI